MNQQAHLKRFLQETPKGQARAVASNLKRLASWAYEPLEKRGAEKMEKFITQTLMFAEKLQPEALRQPASARVRKFKKEFPRLAESWQVAADNHCRRLVWAEKMLTWSNLLEG